MSIIKEITDDKGQVTDEHHIASVKLDEDKVLCFVESRKQGYEVLSSKWLTLTVDEFNNAVPTTEHTEFTKIAKSKAYVALEARYFTDAPAE